MIGRLERKLVWPKNSKAGTGRSGVVKKTLKWWCVFGLVAVRERIWRSAASHYVRALPQHLSIKPRGRSRRLERVLTDFGCEQAFARAAESVREHYGFAIGASAVRDCTLVHAQRAREGLTDQYEQSYRVLPAVGAAHVIAEADGTMICTVQPGRRKGKRPREWKEMRLVAAQAKDSATTVYAATFGSVEETGRRWGHCAREAGRGLNQPFSLWEGTGLGGWRGADEFSGLWGSKRIVTQL